MRFFSRLLVAVACVSLLLSASSAEAARRHHRAHRVSNAAGEGTRDARYADLILNPVTGEVYHQVNADERRYPASLTKMMTLYMLFEALEQRKTSMGARLDVSDYASTMPRTSLSLSPGDTVPVETAIKALIVLSANDVAVVVAEALGGDVDHFGEMMTAKARALGMSNTVFRNPNGLPNSEQYTTARDMAKLGIALKRDFPRYYHYFQTRQFSWGGATYYTHNRVMLRYQGTDGIKTGFTGAAGFNLVTSVTRGGRPLVGVVLGGASGGWRDNRMIQLLDAGYKTIAERGAVRGRVYASNLPTPKNGVGQGVGITPAQAAEVVAQDDSAVPDAADGDEADAPAAAAAAPAAAAQVASAPAAAPAAPKPSPFQAAETAKTVPAASPKAVKLAAATPAAKPVPAPKPQAAPPQAAPVAQAAPAPAAKNMIRIVSSAQDVAWGIQVGAFSTHELAEQAAQRALQLASVDLNFARVSIVGPAPGGASVHRARLENLAKPQAIKACEKLISNNSPCFIYRADPVVAGKV